MENKTEMKQEIKGILEGIIQEKTEETTKGIREKLDSQVKAKGKIKEWTSGVKERFKQKVEITKGWSADKRELYTTKDLTGASQEQKDLAEHLRQGKTAEQIRGERTQRRAEALQGEDITEKGVLNENITRQPADSVVAQKLAKQDIEQVEPLTKGVKPDDFTSDALKS